MYGNLIPIFNVSFNRKTHIFNNMKHSTEALILFCGISFMLGVIYAILLLTFS